MPFNARVMLRKSQIIGLLVPLLFAGGSARVDGGSLPALQVKPWEGYFVAHETRACQFALGCDGVGTITPKNRRGESFGLNRALGFVMSIEEVLPSGKVVVRRVDPDSLETKDKATTKPKTVKYRGKVTGDASFEAVMEFEGSKMRLGGRVLDPGKLKNPLRFVVKVVVRDLYHGADPKDRDFRRKVKDDEVRYETLAGKRGKIEMGEEVDADVEKTISDKGLASMRFESGVYKGRRFEFSCVDGGAIRIEHPAGKPLTGGMMIGWRPDPKKDAEGKARLEISVR